MFFFLRILMIEKRKKGLVLCKSVRRQKQLRMVSSLDLDWFQIQAKF